MPRGRRGSTYDEAQNRSRCTVADDRGKSKRRCIVARCTPTAPHQCSAAGTILEDSAASRPDGNSARPVCGYSCVPTDVERNPKFDCHPPMRKEARASRPIYRPSTRTSFPVSTGSRIDRKYVNNGLRKHDGRGDLRFASIFDRKLFLMIKLMSESNVSMIYLKVEDCP